MPAGAAGREASSPVPRSCCFACAGSSNSSQKHHSQSTCCLQVLLGDKPAIAMSQRMSQGVWKGTAPFLGASLLLALAAATSAVIHLPTPEVAPAAALGALGLLAKGLYSTLGPLLEIRKLSQLSAQQIEEAVDLKEPVEVCCWLPSLHCMNE